MKPTDRPNEPYDPDKWADFDLAYHLNPNAPVVDGNRRIFVSYKQDSPTEVDFRYLFSRKWPLGEPAEKDGVKIVIGEGRAEIDFFVRCAAHDTSPEAGATEQKLENSPSGNGASVPSACPWSIADSSWADSLIGPLSETVYEPALEELKLEYLEARERWGDSPELFQSYRQKVQHVRFQTLCCRIAGPVENLFERVRAIFDHVRSVLFG